MPGRPPPAMERPEAVLQAFGRPKAAFPAPTKPPTTKPTLPIPARTSAGLRQSRNRRFLINAYPDGCVGIPHPNPGGHPEAILTSEKDKTPGQRHLWITFVGESERMGHSCTAIPHRLAGPLRGRPARRLGLTWVSTAMPVSSVSGWPGAVSGSRQRPGAVASPCRPPASARWSVGALRTGNQFGSWRQRCRFVRPHAMHGARPTRSRVRQLSSCLSSAPSLHINYVVV
jgi:hypothetical protein